MSKSFGQLLDEHLEGKTVETIYIYRGFAGEPHIVMTIAEPDYDYTDVFTEDHDLNAEITAKRGTVKELQDQIRTLKRDKKVVEEAIKKIVKFS